MTILAILHSRTPVSSEDASFESIAFAVSRWHLPWDGANLCSPPGAPSQSPPDCLLHSCDQLQLCYTAA